MTFAIHQGQQRDRKERRAQQDTQRAQKMAAGMRSPCTLLLIRHGETDWNRERRLQGQQQPGPPLNELGWQQAELVSQVLQERYPRVDAVFSSDLLRTHQTAGVLAAPYGLQVQQHSGLRERHLGLLQGLTFDEAPSLQPAAWAALQSSSSSSRVPGGGESLEDLQARMVAALCDIAARHKGQRVVVVSHGAALHSVHRAARGYTARGKVINCGISVLLVEPSAAAAAGSGQKTQEQQQQQQKQQRQLGADDCATPQQENQQQQEPHGEALSGPARCCSVSSCQAGTAAAAAAAGDDAGSGAGGAVRCSSSSGAGHACSIRHLPACSRTASGSLKGYCLSGYVDGVNRSCSSSGPGSCMCRDVPGGRLALMAWNDGDHLIEQDMLGAAGISGAFGGSAKEG